MRKVEARLAAVALLVLLVLVGARAVRGEETTSLVDWLTARGEDPSFESRQRRFTALFPGEGYSGTAEQNVRLLDALRLGPVPERPATPTAASTRRAFTEHGWCLTLDLATQVLKLDTPEETVYEQEVGTGRREPPITAQVPLPDAGPLFVSAGLLALKAKQFEDGLYAAVEIASQYGNGTFPSRVTLLQTLRRRLAADTSTGAVVLQGAYEYGQGIILPDTPERLRPLVAQAKAEFEADEKRSKPIGFYTWSPPLFGIFRQDRMLQTPLTTSADVEPLAAALRSDPEARRAYEAWLRLAARLTNPLVGSDLLSDAGPPSTSNPRRFLPASRSHEAELAKRLWGGRNVPEGSSLFDELIPRVKAGTLSLAPGPDSGWYDHVTWSLEVLLRPDTAPEASQLVFTPSYCAYLDELFKGLLALTRETHVKQLEMPFCGACLPPPQIHVWPALHVEPLATHYRRRADAYRFVRGVLAEAFGPEALRTLTRQTARGPVRIDLDTELTFMERLFDGAAETALVEMGSPLASDTERARGDRAVFDAWRMTAHLDPDLAADARMMVPVFHDVERDMTKVWVFLGWQDRPIHITYERKPAVVSLARLPGGDEHKPEPLFHAQHFRIPYPVVAEVFVKELLDRNELRARCDRYKTRSAILKSLR